MKPCHKVWVILLLMTGIAGCSPRSKPVALSSGGPQAWIDAPLDGMRLPLAPYEIVFHITDPVGAAQGELSVNGEVLATFPNPDLTQKLATFRYMWDPQAPGEYTIRTRALNGTGEWSDYSQAIVEIGTLTATPTATETATPTPTLSAAEISIASVSSREIYYRGKGCGPQFVTITAAVKWSSAINYVGLYYRLQDQATGAYTDWQNKTMFRVSAGPPPQYRATIDVQSEIAGYSHFPKAWFQYQIVAKDTGGVQIHSEVFWDIVLSVCTV